VTRIQVGRTVMATGTPVVTKPEADHERVPATVPRIEAQVISPFNAVLSDTLALIGMELRYYAKKRARNPDTPLEEHEARIVGQHVRALAVLGAEEREARKTDDAMSKLTDEQLVKLAGAAIKALQGDEAK
jgi:hypothetical protein